MTDLNTTNRILRQGKALVRAIEALGTSGPIEQAIAGGVQAAVARHCQGRPGVEILSASEHIGSDRAAVWWSDN